MQPIKLYFPDCFVLFAKTMTHKLKKRLINIYLNNIKIYEQQIIDDKLPSNYGVCTQKLDLWQNIGKKEHKQFDFKIIISKN